jgi:hypothetical protein
MDCYKLLDHAEAYERFALWGKNSELKQNMVPQKNQTKRPKLQVDRRDM